MRNQKQPQQASPRNAWYFAALLVAALVVVSLLVALVSPTGSQDTNNPPDGGTVPSADPTALAITKAQLENDKLLREIEKLQAETRTGLSGWLWSNTIATLTALAALGVAGFGVYKWFGDRATEREKRDEERFQQVVNGLGSENEATRIQAAVALRTFTEPGYERFYVQVFNLAVANLRKFGNQQPGLIPGPLEQALTFIFRTSYPRAYELVIARPASDQESELLDATGIILVKAHLNNAMLRHLTMPSANLRGAELIEAQLDGAALSDSDLRQADLSQAFLKPYPDNGNLVVTECERVDFRHALLRATHFHSANLVSARFQDADLTGAHMIEANLNCACFNRAILTNVQYCDAILEDAQFKESHLRRANLCRAVIDRADFTGADLTGVNIESALSMQETRLIDVSGLSEEQLWFCAQLGAIVACAVPQARP